MTAFTLKTAATFEPLDWQEFKADHLHVTHDAENTLIAAYVTAARQWVEHYTQRALCTQTWQLSMHCMARQIWLPRAAPLQSVTFVKYYDEDNVLQTWSSSNYILPAFNEPALIEVLDTATWPSVYNRTDAVQVEYVAGYAAGACPVPLQQAIRLLAAHFYQNREAVMVGTVGKETEFALTSLCAPYRVWWREPSWL